jgi:hypothetical protein
MAEALHVPRAAVDAVVLDFVAYWTIGGGSGRRRSRWARRLRDEVRRKAPIEAQRLAARVDDPPPGPRGRTPEEQAELERICDEDDERARRLLRERAAAWRDAEATRTAGGSA